MSKLMFKRDVCQTCYGNGTCKDGRRKEKTCPDCKGATIVYTPMSNDERIERLERLVEFLIKEVDIRLDWNPPRDLTDGIIAIEKDSKFVKIETTNG
jgi:hypothetical protein